MKYRRLLQGDRLPQDYLDALTEFLGTLASPTFAVLILTPTSLRVPAGSGNDQVSIGISGKWRYNSANADAAAPGGLTVGDNPVYVTASDNVFVSNPSPPPNELDSTDYSFRLKVMAAGGTPSGSGAEALYRQVAWATWDGTKFTDVRPTIGYLPKHGSTHNPGGADSLDYSLVAQTIHLSGALGARPLPVAGNRGFLFLATDVGNGTVYENTAGSAWVQIAAGVLHATQHNPGGGDALDWPGVAQTIHLSGSLAARPAPTSANRGFLYLATDTNGGTIFGNLAGSAWVQEAAGVLHGSTHLPSGADPLPWNLILGAGSLAGRPLPGPTNVNLVYFATDTGQWAQSDGATWLPRNPIPFPHAASHLPNGSDPLPWIIDGWVALSGAWSYVSADAPVYVAQATGDFRDRIQKGTKIKFVQGGVPQFFYVHDIAFGGGATTLTLFGGTLSSLANTAVTAAYYCNTGTPVGFSPDPRSWEVSITDTTLKKIYGDPVNPSPAGYGDSGFSIAVPIGLWRLESRGVLRFWPSGDGGEVGGYAIVSATTNSISDSRLVFYGSTLGTHPGDDPFTGAHDPNAQTWHMNEVVAAAVKTTYHLLVYSLATALYFDGRMRPTLLRVRSIYASP